MRVNESKFINRNKYNVIIFLIKISFRYYC